MIRKDSSITAIVAQTEESNSDDFTMDELLAMGITPFTICHAYDKPLDSLNAKLYQDGGIA